MRWSVAHGATMLGCMESSWLVPVLVRTVVLAGLVAAVGGALYLMPLDKSGGANIGIGLLLFAAQAVIAFAWAWRDSSRVPMVRVLVTWLAVALLASILGTLALRWMEALAIGGLTWRVVLSDLVAAAAFNVVVVFIPAAIGALIGGSVRVTP